MLDFFETFCAIKEAALPSGMEGRQAEVIRKLVAPYVDEIYTDRVGNLICHKRSFGKKLMFPAHMDVIGFMATYIDEHGFIRFAKVGGHTPYALIGTPVVFESGVSGCIRCENAEKASLSAIELDDLYIDIGASSRENALSLVRPGDCAVFAAKPKRIAGGNILTPYADNLASCASLILAISQIKTTPNDLYFVFSTQEEVGCRGAKIAANAIEPYAGIAIDLTRTGDSADLRDNVRMTVRLGGGPTVKIRDSSLICDRPVVEHLRKCAENMNLPYQDEVLPAGGTDSSAMQRSHGGVFSGCVSIPGRNIHTPGEIINEKDAIAASQLLAAAATTEIA